MGMSQLFLVILGAMLVGIAIFVGMSMFSANTVEVMRNAIIHDLSNFAGRACAYYWKPVTMAGGGKSFTGITLAQVFPLKENLNARYFIEAVQDDQCTITGVGKVIATNGDSIRVRIRVTTERNIVEILN
jgi:hypothetical protein